MSMEETLDENTGLRQENEALTQKVRDLETDLAGSVVEINDLTTKLESQQKVIDDLRALFTQATNTAQAQISHLMEIAACAAQAQKEAQKN